MRFILPWHAGLYRALVGLWGSLTEDCYSRLKCELKRSTAEQAGSGLRDERCQNMNLPKTFIYAAGPSNNASNFFASSGVSTPMPGSAVTSMAME